MSFCDAEGDAAAAGRIAEKLNSTRACVYSHTNIDESLALLASAKGIIATRFHAMILAFILNTPVFPIIYHPKMQTVINDSGYKGLSSGLESLGGRTPETVIRALSVSPDIDPEYIKLAADQFAALDGVL
jgi:colanic acid/amylovoran biosynthesis protein